MSILSRLLSACVLLLALPVGAQSAPTRITLILVNGKIWTGNPKQSEAEAVAIAGNRIDAVGSTADIRRLAQPGTQVIDLAGRRMTPGFNDAHVHFVPGGASLMGVHLRDANSPEEFRRRIAAYARSVPKGEWITGGEWDHTTWNPPNLPTHELIDAVTPDNPVFVERLDGHMGLANALAMKLAGVDRNTKDVPGGVIVRDAQGNPTGIFKDAAEDLIGRVIPDMSDAQVRRAILAAEQYAAEEGVTSVQDLPGSTSDTSLPSALRAFEALRAEGRLTVRVSVSNRLLDWKKVAALGLVTGFGDPMLRVGGLKSFADGALGSGTAWMFQPFSDEPGNSGLAGEELQHPDTMYEDMKQGDLAGLQLITHAIGDRANHTILDFYERLEKENGPRDRRLRIEHAQHLAPADIPRFAQLHVIASMQPYHAIDDGRWAERRLGPERIRTSYAWRSLLDSGATLAFGSDWPVAPMDPLMGIYAAATRRTLDGKNPNGWVPDQTISVADAVRAYTSGSAYAEFQEHEKGTIEPGKLADLVVLTDDIFSIEPAQIEHTRVAMTIFDGKVIYRRDKSGD